MRAMQEERRGLYIQSRPVRIFPQNQEESGVRQTVSPRPSRANSSRLANLEDQMRAVQSSVREIQQSLLRVPGTSSLPVGGASQSLVQDPRTTYFTSTLSPPTPNGDPLQLDNPAEGGIHSMFGFDSDTGPRRFKAVHGVDEDNLTRLETGLPPRKLSPGPSPRRYQDIPSAQDPITSGICSEQHARKIYDL